VIGGIRTKLGLFRRIVTDADFRAARIDTGYLERFLAAPHPRLQLQRTATAQSRP
jgi:acetyl-CoA carboxylase biotin carboxylase subunit